MILRLQVVLKAFVLTPEQNCVFIFERAKEKEIIFHQ